MIKIAAICLAAVTLCAACLTKEDLDCWYDDMCKDFSGAAGMPAPPPPTDR
jgi:hypothetical protein